MSVLTFNNLSDLVFEKLVVVTAGARKLLDGVIISIHRQV